MKLYFIRHGEIDANIIKGGSEKLNKTGKKQLKYLSDYLKDIPIDLIITSDLERALDTAKHLHKYYPKAEFIVRPELREIYRVLIGGPPKDHVSSETKKEDKKRMDSFWEELKKMKYDNIAVVCHAHVIRYMIGKVVKITNKDLWKVVIDNCSLTEIEVVKGKAFLVSVDEHRHVKDNSRIGHYNMYAD